MSTVTPHHLRELMKEQNYDLDAFFTSLPTIMYRLLIGNLRCTLTCKLKAVVTLAGPQSSLLCSVIVSVFNFPALPLLLLLVSPLVSVFF